MVELCHCSAHTSPLFRSCVLLVILLHPVFATSVWGETMQSDAPVLRNDSEFGHSILGKFMLQEGFVNLNHGSFGAPPREVIEYQRRLVDEAEALPDQWFRTTYKLKVEESRVALAKYINCDADELVLVENASSGVNAVLRSLIAYSTFEKKKILELSLAYAMIPNTIKFFTGTEQHVESIVVPIRIPIRSPTEIISAVKSVLENRSSEVGLCIFSHISSIPAAILPITELSSLCHSYNIPVLIDGAHALGQIPIDMKQLAQAGVTYYVANGHKWLFSPKGSALLWVKKEAQPQVVPTVISSSGLTDFVGSFEYTGTRDYTAFCSMVAALNFRSTYGDAAIMDYMHRLAVWTTDYLVQLWHTQSAVTMTDMVGAMATVQLPTHDDALASQLNARLFNDYDIYVVVFKSDDAWYTRISCAIYTDTSDIVRMGQLVLELLA